MAGTLNVDTLKADSNLRLQIASANVAFIDASGLNMLGSNLVIGGSTITSTQLSQLNANGTISASAIASINASVATTGTLPTARLPVGTVLQVVSTTKNDTFSTSSTTPVDVTGFSATITPISATSKILVSVSIAFGGDDDLYPYVLLLRNGTSIGTGTSATGNRINVFMGGYFTAIASMTFRMHQFSNNFLDSPATTSALTYKIQLANPYQVVSPTAFINRQDNQSDSVFVQYPTSSITLMEIAA